MQVKDKVVIVTGGGGEIGKVIALTLARRGSKGVCIADIDFSLALKTTQKIKKLGYQSFSIKVDVTKTEDVHKMIETTLEKFGGIDILVNSAGVLSMLSVADLRGEEWDKVIDVNLKGIFLCSKTAARIMVEQKWGRIINISSSAAQFGAPGQAVYCASKAGVLGFTRALAVELGKFNITVNAICPNNVNTEMFREVLKARAEKFKIDYNELVQGILSKIPMRRFTQSKDIAGLVAYLASPDAEHITGQAINVCGGRTSSLF